MKDKTEQIIKASIDVFVKKGYLGATTKEIAAKANVAEITLYRKFKTKQNLFEYSVRNITENRISAVLDFNKDISMLDFFSQLLDNRLMVISKNIKLIRMLISESINENLPSNLRFTYAIFDSVSQSIKKHLELNSIDLNSQAYSKIIGGILLGYAILPNEKKYHTMSPKEKTEYLDKSLKILVM